MKPTETAKRHIVQIGTTNTPIPMTLDPKDATSGRTAEVGVLKGNKSFIEIHSDQDANVVFGKVIRELPTPSMLAMYKEGHLQRQPKSVTPNKPINRLELILGEPGSGKTFMAQHHANLRSKDGAIFADCSGRDLGDLLFETVLDQDKSKSVYDQLDKKMADGGLNGVSRKSLKDALGNAYSTNSDGVASVDWENVRFITPDDDASKEDKAAAEAHNEHILSIINQVAKAEGIDTDKNPIGLKLQFGALSNAIIEDRPIIGDEYTKAQIGTQDKLQVILEVINGGKSECTLSKGGLSLTVRNSELGDNFMLSLTGNLAEDGYSTHDLSKSNYDRMHAHVIGKPTEQDIQARICQKITGLPVSTLYQSQKDTIDEDPDKFSRLLASHRMRGLTEEEKEAVPALQMQMLENWQDVDKASGQLAGFYDKWSQIINPNSDLHKEYAAHDDEAYDAGILAEIDSSYAARTAIGMRKMMKHMDDALVVKPKATKDDGGEQMDPDLDLTTLERQYPVEDEHAARDYGQRLADVIANEISTTTEGKPKLQAYLLHQAAEHGITVPKNKHEIDLNEDYLIANLLNADKSEQVDLPDNLKASQELLVEYIRKNNPDISPDTPDDKIVSPNGLALALTRVSEDKGVDRLTLRTAEMQLATPYSDSEEVGLHDVISVETHTNEVNLKDGSPAAQKRQQIIQEEKPLEDVTSLPSGKLADAESYLISLAIPQLKSRAIDSIFNEYTLTTEEDIDAPTHIIYANTSKTGVAATMVNVKTKDDKGEDRDEFLYVINNANADNGRGQTLVTGSVDISDPLKKALESTGVTYVNRNSDTAKETIGDALSGLLCDVDMNKDTPTGKAEDVHSAIVELMVKRLNADDKRDSILPHPNEESIADRLLPSDNSKHKENLVSVLSNDKDQLTATEFRTPVMLVESDALQEFKNSARALAGSDKAAEQGAIR